MTQRNTSSCFPVREYELSQRIQGFPANLSGSCRTRSVPGRVSCSLIPVFSPARPMKKAPETSGVFVSNQIFFSSKAK